MTETKRRYYSRNRKSICAKAKEYHVQNRDEIIAKKKVRRSKDLAEARRKDKVDYQKHREKRKAAARTFYQSHREALLRDCKKRREEHPAVYLARRYKITVEQYEALREAQAGLCAVCLRPLGKVGPTTNSSQVDHDHVTGRVRGLLHRQCNLMIGNAQDDPRILERGAAYLRRVRAEAE